MPIITKPIPTDNPSGALILYENLLTGTTGGSGQGAALTPTTYDRFINIGGTNAAKYQMAAATLIDSVGIAAHNFSNPDSDVTVIVSVAATIGGALTEVASLKPTDNRAILLEFDEVMAQEVQIVLSVTAGNRNKIMGVLYAGKALQMPRDIYGGHSPITLSQKTEYQSTKSESGQFLGKTVIRKGLETPFSWQLLDDQWYRDDFQPFVQSMVTLPFFIKWRPDFYSTESAYGEVNADIKPVNMGGGHRLMSVGFTMTAHSDI